MVCKENLIWLWFHPKICHTNLKIYVNVILNRSIKFNASGKWLIVNEISCEVNFSRFPINTLNAICMFFWRRQRFYRHTDNSEINFTIFKCKKPNKETLHHCWHLVIYTMSYESLNSMAVPIYMDFPFKVLLNDTNHNNFKCLKPKHFLFAELTNIRTIDPRTMYKYFENRVEVRSEKKTPMTDKK